MSLVVINNIEVNLVSRDGSIFANTLEVSDVFEKRHTDVIRKLHGLSDRAKRNFALKYYQTVKFEDGLSFINSITLIDLV